MPADAITGETVPSHLDWDLWLGPAQERAYSSSYCPYQWRFWWDFGTGEAGNWGCHILDAPFWALGLDHPTRVEATGPEVHPEKTPKSMNSTLQFAGNGERGPVTLHWSARPPKMLRREEARSAGNERRLHRNRGHSRQRFQCHRLYPEDKFADFQAPEPTIPESPGFHQEWIMRSQRCCNAANVSVRLFRSFVGSGHTGQRRLSCRRGIRLGRTESEDRWQSASPVPHSRRVSQGLGTVENTPFEIN